MDNRTMRSVAIAPVLLVTLTALASTDARGETAWRAKPEIAASEGHGEHGGGHRHEGAQRFYLRDGSGAEATLQMPDLSARPLAIEEAAARVPPTGKDGYHLLTARRVVGGEEQVALRYIYMPGKPTGHSPAELLAEPAARLEIIPTPLPREHWRYESGEPAAFMLRFDGQPLANAPVRMITSNGTLLDATTDAKGGVRFALPEDFAQIRPGREANSGADFVVSVSHQSGDARFSTTLNADYFVNPSHWQSTLAGLVVLVGGFVTGLVLVRPGKEQKA